MKRLSKAREVLPIRRIPHAEVGKSGGAGHRFLIAEGAEALIAVVATEAALLHAAKRQCRDAEMNDTIVDAAATKVDFLHEALGHSLTFREAIGGEWVGVAIDNGFRFRKTCYRNDRQ